MKKGILEKLSGKGGTLQVNGFGGTEGPTITAAVGNQGGQETGSCLVVRMR